MSINIALIKESFSSVKPHADQLIERFYKKLFELHPEAKELFLKIDQPQKRKELIGSFIHAVEFIDEADHISTYLRKLGAHHFKTSAQPEHFVWIGEAVLATLEEFSAHNWNAELEHNWISMYSYVVSEMLRGIQPRIKKTPVDVKRAQEQKAISEQNLQAAGATTEVTAGKVTETAAAATATTTVAGTEKNKIPTTNAQSATTQTARTMPGPQKSGLEEMAQQIIHEILKKEMNTPMFQQKVRETVSLILKTAVEAQAEEVLHQVRFDKSPTAGH